jgi:hypothetical protein
MIGLEINERIELAVQRLSEKGVTITEGSDELKPAHLQAGADFSQL